MYLIKRIDSEDEIVVVYDQNRVTPKVISVLEDYKEEATAYPFNFQQNFLENKNFMNSKCSGDFIFQLDADELPHEFLLSNLKGILEMNDIDLLLTPRKNLVEGMFDALTIKRNVIPLFGKIIHEKLMKKLVASSVNRIYIALDPDAIKNALKYCEQLMAYGKEIYLVELTGKDANEIGFEQFLNTIENTQPLNFQSLLMKKLK